MGANRLDEARLLAEGALKSARQVLEPGRMALCEDACGWVAYRQGRLEEAVDPLGAVDLHGHGLAVLVERDGHLARVAVHRLVHGVVDDLPDEVVEPGRPGGGPGGGGPGRPVGGGGGPATGIARRPLGLSARLLRNNCVKQKVITWRFSPATNFCNMLNKNCNNSYPIWM